MLQHQSKYIPAQSIRPTDDKIPLIKTWYNLLLIII